ncbi:MAG TPA: MFS transporter [Burkholderiales bacterium]|nr:MFS transporter [Burkholderiales bacterium]
MISKPPRTRQIVAAVVGNALEWYDFVVYGFLTIIIARLFFPAQSEYASLLLTMATFGVGFFMRPVGGIVLGMYADRKGRKAALQLIIGLMTLAMAMIAFAPPYAAIGIAAPLIILLARLLQGFSTGGEFASATSFLVESAPPNRRGFYGSLQMVGQSLAALSGAVAGTLITRGLGPEQIDSWGWRVPFLFGLIIGPVGLYIRRYLEETDAFLDSRHTNAVRNPLRTVFAQNGRGLAVTFGLVICGTISYYVVLVYMPTFAKTQLGMPLTDAFVAQVIGLVCLTATIPLCGALSDRIGRRPILVAATIAYFVLLYPLFDWVYTAPSLLRLAIMQGILCTLVGVFFGPISTAIAEQFPTGVRSTGLAIAYNFAVMLFGGFAQFIVTWLIRETGSPLAPAYYVMFGAVVGFVASVALVERYRDHQLPKAV